MIDPELERDLRMLKLHDQPRLRDKIAAAHGSVARAWIVLGLHLQHGLGVRTDRVSAREAYKSGLKGDPGAAASAAFHLATLLEDHPELCEEYGDGRKQYGTSPDLYWREGAKLAVAAADARFHFWAPNQRTPDLAAAITPLIRRRRQDAAFGDPEAMYELARLLHEGFGVPRHQADAALWLHRAATAGHLGAACRLKPAGWQAVARGAIGHGTPVDDAPTLSTAPGPGDAPALGGGPASPFQLLRASLPLNLPVRWAGTPGEPRPDDAARADAGELEAQVRLGLGAEEEGERAYWLILAAAAGHPAAFTPRDALPAHPEAEARAAIWWERRFG